MSRERNWQDPHRGGEVLMAGAPLEEARAAMILLHRRSSTAEDIMEVGYLLELPGFAYLAPQATGNTWFLFSLLAPLKDNEPGLSSALGVVGDLIARLEKGGIPAERVIIGGFSQGACLAAEFAARNPRRYGGLLIFSGCLIGPPDTPRDYQNSLDGTPVFIGCSDDDYHIPIERVEETTAVLTRMGAAVHKKIYPKLGHTIIQNELHQAYQIVYGLAQSINS